MDLRVLEDLLDRIDEFLEITDELPLELWIGQKDGYVYRMKMEQEVNLGRFIGSPKRGEVPNVVPGQVNLKLDINFSNFNQPLEIETPLEVKLFEDIISREFYLDYLDFLYYEPEP